MSQDKKRNRIGILGGTFNPIHIGHLMIAESAYEQYQLDQVWIMPAGAPPHKEQNKIASNEHRKEMIRLAIEDNSHLQLSDVELIQDRISYTYETLEYLKKKYEDTDFYFIIGTDSLYNLEKWMYPERIFENCVVLAAGRNQNTAEEINGAIQILKERYGADIRLLDSPDMEIASEDIRMRIQKNRTIKYFVPGSVETYIYKNNLYK